MGYERLKTDAEMVVLYEEAAAACLRTSTSYHSETADQWLERARLWLRLAELLAARALPEQPAPSIQEPEHG